jgi:uncharacterized membrane protein
MKVGLVEWLFLFGLTLIPLIFAFAIYIKINVWYECRVDHSFFYCLSLISK